MEHASERGYYKAAIPGCDGGSGINSVYVTTKQAAIAEAFQNVVDTWTSLIANYPGSEGNPSGFHLHYDYLHLLDTKQPYVTTRCLENSLTTPINGSGIFSFPNRQSRWTSDNGHWTTTDLFLETIPNNSVLESESYRIAWFDLPEGFTNALLGAVINTPPNSTSPNIYLYACTIYPSWGSAIINTTQDLSDIIFSTNPPTMGRLSLLACPMGEHLFVLGCISHSTNLQSKHRRQLCLIG